jgi:hypothetical protein
LLEGPGEGLGSVLGARRRSKTGVLLATTYLKELSVKKIAIALVATATLTLAACSGEKAANNAADTNATEIEADADLNAANGLEEANTVENGTANATDTTANATSNETAN